MKILIISDTSVKNVEQLIKECDLLVTCGDLSPWMFQHVNKRWFGVYGNHCDGKYIEELGGENLHLKTKTFSSLTFGGFESCIKYKEELQPVPLYTQDQVATLIKGFPPVDIFVSHSPPYGLLDDITDHVHTGFTAFRDYIDRNSPKYFLCGHLYSNEDMKYKDTKIIRTYGYQWLQI